MARKADSFYFDNFNACAENNCRAARLLEQVMREYDPDGLQARIDEMHELEQAGDELRHELLDCVLTAFITPIEREGIVALSAGSMTSPTASRVCCTGSTTTTCASSRRARSRW